MLEHGSENAGLACSGMCRVDTGWRDETCMVVLGWWPLWPKYLLVQCMVEWVEAIEVGDHCVDAKKTCRVQMIDIDDVVFKVLALRCRSPLHLQEPEFFDRH